MPSRTPLRLRLHNTMYHLTVQSPTHTLFLCIFHAQLENDAVRAELRVTAGSRADSRADAMEKTDSHAESPKRLRSLSATDIDIDAGGSPPAIQRGRILATIESGDGDGGVAAATPSPPAAALAQHAQTTAKSAD
jgi:hypothetical protein